MGYLDFYWYVRYKKNCLSELKPIFFFDTPIPQKIVKILRATGFFLCSSRTHKRHVMTGETGAIFEASSTKITGTTCTIYGIVYVTTSNCLTIATFALR
jgi:hypothetical protein